MINEYEFRKDDEVGRGSAADATGPGPTPRAVPRTDRRARDPGLRNDDDRSKGKKDLRTPARARMHETYPSITPRPLS